VNKKKCPKCGEENPAEAVMCWACYTPLAGAAPATAGGPAGAAQGAAPINVGEDGEKKKIPPWQLGVVGAALLAGLFVGVRAIMPSSASDDGDEETTETKKPDGEKTPDAAPAPAVAPSAAMPVVPTGPGTVAVAPLKAPFDIVVPPNPKISVATMAIVPTEANSSGPQAAALAAYTRRQYSNSSKSWSKFYVYVFSDAQSGQFFADYQIKRKGAPLEDSDFSFLANLWSSCLARYEYTPGKGVERVVYPSKSPSGWWYQRNQ
jgi:hypothetical protein